jgi:hypothetical protein
MSSISSSLYSGSDALADLTDQIRKNGAIKVQTFQAYVEDVAKDKIDMRPNQNRLNVFSMVNPTDSEDFFRFNLKFGGTIHLGMLVDSIDSQRRILESKTAKGLGIQVLQYQGSTPKVIADSDASSGGLYETYKQLTGGDGARLKTGKYAVRVYREPTVGQSQQFFYSFQLAGDRFYQDYDTMQSEAPAHPKTKSTIEMMTINPAVLMLAANLDPTMSVAMAAATRPTRLSTTVQDGVNPVTQLLDAFM